MLKLNEKEKLELIFSHFQFLNLQIIIIKYDFDLYYFKYFHCCVHIYSFLVCRRVGSKGKDFSLLGLPQ